ncbi:serine hydrolase domain-containing protein [Dietzia sp. PP-33]|uniref:serine hydrolase domain-containing protein n=1 Tax=Dietzia sp. PP-33 TaxID=2957500 RepID=UPI0029B27B6C|nr:serine hydrolase domain-containing protein [Dietzia sp. PP-33]MDX2358032.1 beta-lactamase family protein [Dietzia sp. PP-33]
MTCTGAIPGPARAAAVPRTWSGVGIALVAVIALLAVLVIAPTVAPAAAGPAAGGVDLEAEAARLADELGAPGVAVAVVDSTGVVGSAHHGVDGDGAPVGERTTFVWGSVSKSFAALVVSVLDESGTLSASDRVASVLPALRGGELDTTGVTIADLVHHVSGLPHQVEITDVWGRTSPASEVVPEIADVAGLGPRGTYRYSSLNYLLLQAVVETVTQRPYGDVLDEVLASTAGVTDVVTDPGRFAEDVPPGHAPYFFGERPVDVGFDSAGLAYGYLSGPTDSLAKYAAWQLGDLRSTSTESVERRDGAVGTGTGGRYGNGLIFEDRSDGDDDEVTVVRHSGAVPGYFTYLALAPERDVGVVLVANSYGELRSGESAGAAGAFADRIMGLPSGAQPDSGLYTGVIVGGIVLVLLLVALLGWVVTGLVRRPSPRRSTRATVTRVLLVSLVGAALLVGGLLGVPAVVGVPLGVASLWAPDAALLVWLTMGLVFLVTAVTVARELAWNHRVSGGVSASPDRPADG